jgi:membrane-associated phospholipid phosphatase
MFDAREYCYKENERRTENDCMRKIVLVVAALTVAQPVFAAAPTVNLGTTMPVPLSKTKKDIETLGTGVAIALPLVAGGISYFKHDTMGLAQLTVETVFTVGTAYAIKNIVRERRPDGSDYQSFPSDTTALAASGSSYLWGRYGWQYGLPAFLATQFVSYSRIQAKKHHWYDTLASSAIAAGYGYALTTPFKRKYNIDTSLEATPDGAAIQLSYNF